MFRNRNGILSNELRRASSYGSLAKGIPGPSSSGFSHPSAPIGSIERLAEIPGRSTQKARKSRPTIEPPARPSISEKGRTEQPKSSPNIIVPDSSEDEYYTGILGKRLAAGKIKKKGSEKRGVTVQKHAKLKKHFSEDSLQNYNGKTYLHFCKQNYFNRHIGENFTKTTKNSSRRDRLYD